MEKPIILIAGLIVLGLITLLFGKVIGPRLLDWFAPRFAKSTDKLDDLLTQPPNNLDRKLRVIVQSRPEDLEPLIVQVFARFAEPRTSPPSLTLALPISARKFFEKYHRLSFDGHTSILDAKALKVLDYKARRFLVIGQSEDDDHFYAIQGDGSIVRLQTSGNGRVLAVEEDAPSFEHFVALQHAIHCKSEDT